jgi:plasmid replication initiation protein
MDDNIIIKDNSFIEGLTDMSTIQYKFTLYLISLLNKEDKQFRKLLIPIAKYAEFINANHSNMYRQMKSFEKQLLSKSISIYSSNGSRIHLNWFTKIAYLPKDSPDNLLDNGVLEVNFSPDLCPYLLQLDKAFTKYLFKNIKDMKSFFSMRLYELLKKEQFKSSKIYLELEKLREILQISINEYKLFGDFNRRVLKKSEQEINEHTDIFIRERKNIKSSKKVIAIQYTIEANPKFNHKHKNSNPDVNLKSNEKSINKKTGIEQRTYSDEFYDSLYE